MQFQVPQFIEVEDKIFGPLTFRQFVYMAGGMGTCYILWRVLPVFIAGPLILAVGGLTASLAFLQYNGRPFINALEHGFYYLIRAKLYLWSNKQKGAPATRVVQREAKVSEKPLIRVPKLSDSKLHELAWSLDIKERMGEAADDDLSEEISASLRAPRAVQAGISAA